MAVLIRNVTITPKELYTGESFKVSVKAEEPTWNSVKAEFGSWEKVKAGFENWQKVKGFDTK